MLNNTLYVIAVVSNPAKFKRRTQLFREFCQRIEALNADIELVRVELAYGNEPFVLTDPLVEFDIQLRADYILWHKENMINVAMGLLPDNWEYVAWVDTDITFINPNWVEDTVAALQKHQVVQMFSKALDLDSDGLPMKTFTGFAYKFVGNGRYVPVVSGSKTTIKDNGGIFSDGDFWHPGFAWAARREAIEVTDGLMEFPILGSADHLMALSYVGCADRISSLALSSGYLRAIDDWQKKAEYIDGNIGYVPGLVAHHYHGKKINRGYHTRTQTLVNYQFDPHTDLKHNKDGVLELVIESDRQHALREELVKYFYSRKEDE